MLTHKDDEVPGDTALEGEPHPGAADVGPTDTDGPHPGGEFGD